MKKIILTLGIVVAVTASFAFYRGAFSGAQPVHIKWYTIDEAQALNKQSPRKIFMDISTSWCGWCKRMDATTFENSVIAKYMSEHYYCVKFDAETHDTITFNGQKFWNRGPADQPRSVHDFAITVLQGHLMYPSFAFISKNQQTFTIMQGYMTPEQFEPYLHFYSEDRDPSVTYQDFLKTFKSELPPDTTSNQNQGVAFPH